MSKYIIGIDLGTTNSTLSYINTEQYDEAKSQIQQLKIRQIEAGAVIGESYTLPSFLYFFLSEEKVKNEFVLKRSDSSICVGAYAKERGSEVPTRVISSAKSWLCHSSVDPKADILPLSKDDDFNKISPVAACAEVLKHLAREWNNQFLDDAFEQQHIYITVPASFDPAARQLVSLAAKIAKYPEVTLLEEPQAAFYAWLEKHKDDWRHRLNVGDSVLVVDIGGGTSDFSLVEVAEDNGNMFISRKAVGSHLLLGGDNIDLALAYFMRNKFEDQSKSVSDWQFQSLIHQCQKAKELVLGDTEVSEVDITLLGRGSKLIGGSIKSKISKEDVRQIVLDGFFPLINPEERAADDKRQSIEQLGLSYTQDPRISAQLAKFLSMSSAADNFKAEHFVIPTVVLFNGGTLKASAIAQRLVEQLNSWSKQFNKECVAELNGADLDFGVSKGAVKYGLAVAGHGLRIKSSISRSYYLGVDEPAPAVPGFKPKQKAICIAPIGMEEGDEAELVDQSFILQLGNSVSFSFFENNLPVTKSGEEPKLGDKIDTSEAGLRELKPVEAYLDPQGLDSKMVEVRLKSKVTPLGVLELWCVGDNGLNWILEFDTREN